MADYCKMMIDEETTVESLDSGDCAYADGLENKLQETDENVNNRMIEQRKRRAPKGTKKRRQNNDVGEPSEVFHPPDSAMELESQQQACDIVQGRDKNKMNKLIPVRPRKQQSPDELLKAKGKGHQTFDVSQPPEPMGKEKPVRVLFMNEKKSRQAVRKILRDRVNRRRNIVSEFGLDNPAVNLRKDKEDLDKELFDKKNIQVEVSDFHGLQDAINGAGDGIPDHLKPFAMIIEQGRGECTPANSPYQTLLLLLTTTIQCLSAAVKEMQELPNNELNRPILRKWAAISNLADRMGFPVPFFKNLLLKNMHAYLHYSRMNSG